MTKISVIIPVFNTVDYIARCIESVLEQKGVELECVVVDDCGTDGSMSIVEAFRDPRLKIVRHAENRGLSAARNTGFEASTGEWIYYLDSDDYMPDRTLEIMARHASPEVDWIQGGYERISPEKTWYTIYPAGHYKTHEQIASAFGKINLHNASCKLINRRIAEHKFIEGLIFEDTIWCQQLYPRLNNIVVLDIPTYCHNVRQGSIMQSSFTPKKAESQLYLIRQIVALDPDINQQHTATSLAMNFIKNIFMAEFPREYRRELMQKLAATGVYKLELDRGSLPRFTKILSLSFGSPHHTYYRILCDAYKKFKR